METRHSQAKLAFTILRKSFVHKAVASRDNGFRHTFSTQRCLARSKTELFTFHQEEAAVRRPQNYPVYPKMADEAPRRRDARGCTKHRFITFYEWPVKLPL